MEKNKDRSALLIRALPVLVVLAVVVALYVRHRVTTESGPEPAAGAPAAQQGYTEPPPTAAAPETGEGGPESRWRELTGSDPVWPADLDSPTDCGATTEALSALCRKLDDRPYVRAWDLPHGVLGLVTEVSGDLGARPPTVEGIWDSLDTVRANVTHFFRVLGRRRLPRLKTIVANEPDLAEPLALATYRWMRLGEGCGDDVPHAMSREAQYEYAYFLVGTLGGQAYLRRRPPRLEALAGFYALLILDEAVARGHDPHGVDLRAEIARCRSLMTAQDLVFRDRYLEILDAMDRRWRRRAGA